MNSRQDVINVHDSFFFKKNKRTSHETLAHYETNCIPGEDDGLYYTHICYNTIKKALIMLTELNKNNYNIVETGCSAEHGTKSTLLWDKVINVLGGQVFSVDLNKVAVDKTNILTSNKTNVVCSNSLDYLPTLKNKIEHIDFLYLDSYDVDFLNPEPSALHHLEEFNCVKELLHKNSIILIDDTPITPEWLDNGKKNNVYNNFKSKYDPHMTGKGSLVIKELEKMGATQILHQYQVLYIMN